MQLDGGLHVVVVVVVVVVFGGGGGGAVFYLSLDCSRERHNT